jgi:DNA repair protein SbcC/Rad50
MRIKKLLIKNLGKHKHLEAKLDGSVVGLMGPNGSGKSTILKLIHFLVTGWTPAKETQESFIRKVDPELEAEPAYGLAEMEFHALGNNYRISRKIGSPSSRKLSRLDHTGAEVKEDTYTRADEIQSALTDILGADKYAIDNAVFPEQGALDKILFGSQADREELLVKLLLLGHMQKVADVAAGKIKILASEIQDFSSLHDELQSSRNTAEQELAKSEEQLTRTRSYAEEIKMYESWDSTVNEINSNAAHSLNAKNAARTNDEAATNALSAQADKLGIKLTSVEELAAWVEKLKDKIKSTRNLVSTMQEIRNKSIHYKNISERIDTYTVERVPLLFNLPEEVPSERINNLHSRISEQRARINYKRDLDQATVEGKRSRELIDTLNAESITLAKSMEDLEAKMQVLANEASLFKTITETCKLALDSGCTADCPVCGENVSHEKLRDRFATYDKKLRETMSELNTLKDNYGRVSKDTKVTQNELTQRQTLLSVYIKQYKDNKALLDAGVDENVEALNTELTDLLNAVATRNSVLKRLAVIDSEIKTLELSIKGFTQEEINSFNSVDITALDNEVVEANNKIEHWSLKLDELSQTYTRIGQLVSARDTELKRSEEFADVCRRLAIKRDEVFNSFPPQLKQLVDQDGEVKDTLIEKNKIFNQLEATAAQLRIQANSIRKRLREIEDKIKLDGEKRAVIQELQRIVSAFSRQGIPMSYVQHKFDSLVSMTQDNLEIMDANFAIIPHPTKPVSLQFYRLDEPGQVLFDHDKLSGGQKVRLSIAFLLAVQQLVIPDLGFLVLDEPSTHLDEEARENLKELLLNLNQQLESTDTQILVCDHARELEPAFVNVIQL